MSDEFDAMLASVPGGADEEEENDPASMEAFSDFLGGAEAEDEDEDEDDPAADVKAMQQALVNERVAHMDLLPHRFELVAELQEQMKNQQATIDALQQAGQTLDASCLQMDVDRVRFMVVSYARCRIFKIQRYYLHLEQDEEVAARMSEQERAYWQRYSDMRKKHFNSEVLDYCPVQYNQMDAVKSDYDVDMVVRPKKDQHVFFKALEDCGSVQIGEDDPTPVMKDDILCVPYDTIDGFLHGDKQGEGGAAGARGVLL